MFGFTGTDAYSGIRHLDGQGCFFGVGEGRHIAIATNSSGVTSASGFSIGDILNEPLPANYKFGLGKCSALICEVAAGEKRTFRFALCFYREGAATSGLDMRYLYTRYFPNIEAVAAYALEQFETLKADALQSAFLVKDSALSERQQWMVNHSVRSY